MSTIINERYNSIADFQKSLERKKIGKMYDESDEYKFTKDFCGTSTHKEADELLINGDTFTAKIIEGCNKNKRFERTTNTIKQDFCGFVPNVGAVVSGSPINMYNVKQTTYRNTKVLNLVYFIGASYNVKTKELCAAGAKLLNVVNTLEAQGYRINLFAARCVIPAINGKNQKNSLLNLAVKIKDSGKHLNITKIAYPVAHPSFFRRHCFAWADRVCKNVTDTYSSTDPKILKAAADKICKGAKFVNFYTLHTESEEDILRYILE